MGNDLKSTTNVASPFIKAGEVTTNAAGYARVNFVHPFESGMTYSVVTTSEDQGDTVGAIIYVVSSDITGFDVYTREPKLTGGNYSPVPNVIVNWIAMPSWS